MQEPQQEQNVFDYFSNQAPHASSGKRFANYLIDLAGFYIFMYFFSYVIVEISMDLAIILYGENQGFNIMGRLLFLLFYGMFMGLQEAVFKGRSLGKLITGTVAINIDGSRISGQAALLRGLIRGVPFNTFSALGDPTYPWHDKWSKTYVVNYKDINRHL